MKVSELKDQALDWAVAKALGYDYEIVDKAVITGRSVMITDETDPYFGCSTDEVFNPSTNWNLAGPIIEQEKIETYYQPALGQWAARCADSLRYGPTPLIAAMRSFVAHRIGDVVDVPDELLAQS